MHKMYTKILCTERVCTCACMLCVRRVSTSFVDNVYQFPYERQPNELQLHIQRTYCKLKARMLRTMSAKWWSASAWRLTHVSICTASPVSHFARNRIALSVYLFGVFWWISSVRQRRRCAFISCTSTKQSHSLTHGHAHICG